LSGHEPASELTRVNRGASRATQAISREFHDVLECALEIAARSNGAFDPTIGGELVMLGLLPSFAEHERGVTWRDVELGGNTVRFRRPLILDLDGIAKGYAIDRAIAALQAAGATQSMVNAGGDLRVHGPNAETVALRTGGAQSAMLPLVSIADGAVATSAYGGRRRRISGRFATPLIDPRTRLPSMSTRTVSVAASTCMIADALTKVVALDGDRSARLLDRYAATATIVSPAQGRWRCTRLPR
jgi:thiamine biosynthesis lipoprotein